MTTKTKRLIRVVTCSLLWLLSPLTMADQPNQPVHLFNTLPVAADAYDRFLPVMLNNAHKSRAEPGNISFDVFAPEAGGNNLYLFEQWQNQPALEQHQQQTHFKKVAAATGAALQPGAKEISLRLKKLSIDQEPRLISEPDKTRNVIVTLHVAQDAMAEVTAALLNMIPHARKANGNLRYDLYVNQGDPNQLIVFEQWVSGETHESHLTNEYNAPVKAALKDNLTSPLVEHRLLLKDLVIHQQ